MGYPTCLFLTQNNNMACLLTSGRKLPCKASVGGIKSIGFADYGTLGTTVITSGSIDLDITTVWYEFEVKGASNLDTAINSSTETRSTFYESTLSMDLAYLDVATQEQIKLLAHARPHIVVTDYNGNYFLLGKEHGCEVTGGNIVTGTAMGDKSGIALTFTAQETAPPFFIGDASTYTAQVSATQIDPTA